MVAVTATRTNPGPPHHGTLEQTESNLAHRRAKKVCSSCCKHPAFIELASGNIVPKGLPAPRKLLGRPRDQDLVRALEIAPPAGIHRPTQARASDVETQRLFSVFAAQAGDAGGSGNAAPRARVEGNQQGNGSVHVWQPAAILRGRSSETT